MSLFRRSEVDGEQDRRNRKTDEGTDPDADRQSEPLASPFTPAGHGAGRRSSSCDESDNPPQKCTRCNRRQPSACARRHRKPEHGKCRTRHDRQNESDDSANRRLGTPENDDAEKSAEGHRDEGGESAIGAQDTEVVGDSFGNRIPRRWFGSVRWSRWTGICRWSRPCRSWLGRGRGSRCSRTRSAGAGHRLQLSATHLVRGAARAPTTAVPVDAWQ